MKKERTLVVLAAGIGSRFKDGVKQLKTVGPSGEVIMDYSIYDAIEAGFNRVIFIIRHDIQELFDSMIGDRIRAACAKKGVEVLCAYQEKTNLPGGYVCPEDRVKPWGTGHALLSCKGMLHGGFAVINSDDYYGKDSYRQAIRFLDSLEEDSKGTYGLIGFQLGNTLSEYGGVTRGLCQTENGWLTHILETREIVKTAKGASAEVHGQVRDLDVDIPVSMNMWGFTNRFMAELKELFPIFLTEYVPLNPAKAEMYLPSVIGLLLKEERASVKVLRTPDKWYGVTYAADKPAVIAALKRLTAEGKYPDGLWK